jgi:hypothetical protein
MKIIIFKQLGSTERQYIGMDLSGSELLAELTRSLFSIAESLRRLNASKFPLCCKLKAAESENIINLLASLLENVCLAYVPSRLKCVVDKIHNANPGTSLILLMYECVVKTLPFRVTRINI